MNTHTDINWKLAPSARGRQEWRATWSVKEDGYTTSFLALIGSGAGYLQVRIAQTDVTGSSIESRMLRVDGLTIKAGKARAEQLAAVVAEHHTPVVARCHRERQASWAIVKAA